MKLDKPLNKYFDHTLLKPEATNEQIEKLLEEAKEYDFYSVCVNTCYVKKCYDFLKDTDVKIAAVIGFPLGACTIDTKVFEANEAFKLGASEVDMVLNVGRFKNKEYDYILKDISSVVEAAKKYNGIVKVILETCLLTKEEIKKACEISRDAGANFVKTSTGFNTSGAKEEDVKLMKDSISNNMEVKASGGIRDLEATLNMIKSGATRIGASASVQIMKDYINKNMAD